MNGQKVKAILQWHRVVAIPASAQVVVACNYKGGVYQGCQRDSESTLPMIQIRDFIGRQWRLMAVIAAFCLALGAVWISISPFRSSAQTDMIIDTKRVSRVQSEMSSESRLIDEASVESTAG
jgi:uncharacterized protein involved in exopolysaccharide biosynthesis